MREGRGSGVCLEGDSDLMLPLEMDNFPNPGSTSGDGPPDDLVDQGIDSTQDSNSAEFSRETSTVLPPSQAAGGATPLVPTGGQAATDQTGTLRI